MCAACTSSRILKDRDYSAAVKAYRDNDPVKAQQKFPKGEAGGFITSVEKAWLDQARGEWRPDLLSKQVESIENRQPVYLSEEARILFDEEDEPRYLPAEYEIVVMHILHATHLLQTKKQEDARVELRRAALILEQQWDDAGLRLWLAALWRANGDWEEARVDLRRANELQPHPQLKAWADQEEPPPQMNVHFVGTAPDIRWTSLHHKPDFQRSTASAPTYAVATSTERWFTRHREKDHVVREIAREGRHTVQTVGMETLTMTERTGAKALTWGIRTAGVATGVAIGAGAIYLLAQGGGAGGGKAIELAGWLAIGAGVGIWKAGAELDHQMTRFINKKSQEREEDLRSYRLVRFLPEWIGLSADTDRSSAPGRVVALGNGVQLEYLPH